MGDVSITEEVIKFFGGPKQFREMFNISTVRLLNVRRRGVIPYNIRSEIWEKSGRVFNENNLPPLLKKMHPDMYAELACAKRWSGWFKLLAPYYGNAPRIASLNLRRNMAEITGVTSKRQEISYWVVKQLAKRCEGRWTPEGLGIFPRDPSNIKTKQEAYTYLIDYFGSYSEIARVLCVSRQFIHQYESRELPEKYVKALVTASEGDLLPWHIRPDLYSKG